MASEAENELPFGSAEATADDMDSIRRKRIIERLTKLMADQKIKNRQLSRKAGLNDSFVSDLFGRGRFPKIENLQKIADALGVPLSYITEDVTVPKEDSPPFTRTRLAPVRGTVQAGHWFEFDEPSVEYDPIPAVPTRYNGEQFAFKVVGTSMDQRRILHGDYVVCVPYWQNIATPKAGDIVVVENRRGDLVERTVKEMVVNGSSLELWPRSSDARHKPIIVDLASGEAAEGTTVEIVGLVVAIHVPIS